MKSLLKTFSICVVVVLSLLVTSQGFGIVIEVAPNTLNLSSQGTVVTVHTDIDYVDVVSSSVWLNGILIQSSKADSRGDFVAKFNMAAVKDLVASKGLTIPGVYTLTLTGKTTDGDDFSGSKEIAVVDVKSAGK